MSKTPPIEFSMSECIVWQQDDIVIVYDTEYINIDGKWFKTYGDGSRKIVAETASPYINKLIENSKPS